MMLARKNRSFYTVPPPEGFFAAGFTVTLHLAVFPESSLTVIVAFPFFFPVTFPFLATVRTTYLIDEDGVIIKAFGKVKAADNPQQMLEELGK